MGEEEIKDQSGLLAVIQKNMWLDSDIINVSINIPQAEKLVVYVSNQQSLINKNAGPGNWESFSKDIFISRLEKINNSEVLVAITPIHISGKIVGTIQIDFDLDSVNNKIEEHQTQEVSYYLVIFILSIIVLTIIFELVVVRPILKVTEGVKSVANLDFSSKINVKSRDEIGDLANSFNEMSNELKESRTKLQQYNQDLEKQVADKTNELKNINLDLESKVKERTSKLEELRTNQEKIIAERTAELEQKLKELEKMNSIMINREIKMVELKEEIRRLSKGE